MQISFSRSVDPFEAVTINNKPKEVVTSWSLTISSNLKWNGHIENVIKKGASRLYLLRQLKRAKGDPAQLLCFYTTCIRPMSEYACQVFHNGLSEYLSEELEKIQRRALRIIFPDLGYQEALKECNIATLHQRRQWLTYPFVEQIDLWIVLSCMTRLFSNGFIVYSRLFFQNFMTYYPCSFVLFIVIY